MNASIATRCKLAIGIGLFWVPLQQVFATDSQIGFFTEPAFTYELGATTADYPSPFSHSSGRAEGFGLGLRAGFHRKEYFFGGLDLRYARTQFTDSSIDYDAKSVSTNWGPVIGMQMPAVGMRFWATYVLGGELNPDGTNNLNIKFFGASGHRLGVGFRVFTVGVNFERQQLKYDHGALELFGPFPAGSTFDDVDLSNSTWIVSVSFPLVF